MTPIIVDTPITGLTYAELRLELKARHPEFLTDPRCLRFINDAYLEITDEQPWPFLETEANGSTPLDLGDVKSVLSVETATDRLRYVDPRELPVDRDLSGSPCLWFLVDNTLHTYPTSSDDVTVRYSRVPEELAQDADQAVLPKRFCRLIVDLAWSNALAALGRHNDSQAQRQVYERGLMTMVDALMVRYYDGPEWVASVENA